MKFKIPVEIYRTEVHVIYNESDEDALKYYSKFGGDFKSGVILGDHTEARCICDSSGIVFVRFKENPEHSTVAHEFLHATFFILNDRGLSLEAGSEEAYAYLLGYLLDKFYSKINKL